MGCVAAAVTVFAGKIVGAVCHGPIGLILAKNAEGKPLVSGKRVTGFTNSEEEAVGKTKVSSVRSEASICLTLGGLA
jgi:putative intracellular protease/amidase